MKIPEPPSPPDVPVLPDGHDTPWLLDARQRDGLLSALWLLCLLLIPVTSPVWLGGSEGGIRPLAAIPALLAMPLVLLSLGPRIWQEKSIAWTMLAAMGILVSGLLLAVWDGDAIGRPLRLGWYAKGALSLAVGLAFYLIARDRLRTSRDLEAATPWILGGMSVSVLLAFFQVLSVETFPSVRNLVSTVSAPFSSVYATVSVPHSGRGHGFAYEPSYLASQLYLTILPLGIWLLLRGRRALGLSCIALATFGCLISGSRMGILSCSMILFVGIGVICYLGSWRLALHAGICAIICLVAGGALIRGNSYVNGSAPPSAAYLASNSDATEYGGLVRLVERMNVGPRAAALVAGIRVFAQRPLLGCGLGTAPLFLRHQLPKWSLGWQEVQAWVLEKQSAKTLSLWSRVLAEVGLLGVLLLTCALYRHFPSGKFLSACIPVAPFILAVFLDGFLLSSFALMGPWLTLAALPIIASIIHNPPLDHGRVPIPASPLLDAAPSGDR